jgi:iron complex outermembrane receptor protein
VTPLAGVVVKPWQNNVSLYANYIEGLSKGDIAPATATNAGEMFAPYKAKQKEIGAKVEWGRMVTTLSLFQITKPSGQQTNGLFAVDAEQRNRGIELNTSGRAAPGVSVTGGITWLQGVLTHTNSATTQGRKAIGVPSVQANLGLEWDVPWLPGLALSGGLTHTGKQYVDRANTLAIPAWTTLDLGARYRTQIAGKTTTFRANLRNAADRAYWASVSQYGSLVQGAPRALVVSATVDF